jgi:hypothetical protein
MTPEEFYDDEMAALEKAFEEEKRRIILEYAKMKNTFPAGAIIEDHVGKGEVISFKVSLMLSKYPDLVYKCRVLTKDGKPTKKLEYRNIYLSNVKTK